MLTRACTYCLLILPGLLLLSGCDVLNFAQAPTPTPIIILPSPTPGGAAPADPFSPTATTATDTLDTPPSTDAPMPAPGRRLAQVQARGTLICGVNAELQGFGFYDNVRGQWSGFDVDFCRVVAAAIFGDATRVDFRAVAAEDRWEFIRQGTIDVLFRNSTWTAERDLGQRVDFGPITFHDGQAFWRTPIPTSPHPLTWQTAPSVSPTQPPVPKMCVMRWPPATFQSRSTCTIRWMLPSTPMISASVMW